ncbi:MAG: response regulator [Saprospiraceae bacterium]
MFANKKIVLVEDNPADVMLAEIALQNLAVKSELLHFSNGKEFVQFLPAANLENISLILLDLNMPLMNGWEVLKFLKSDAKWRQLPVVVFSCSSAQKDISSCYALGANAFVQKPTDLGHFDEIMASIISFWGKTNINPSFRFIS